MRRGRLRDRFFQAGVARAITIPAGIVAGSVAAAALLATGVPAVAAVAAGLAAWSVPVIRAMRPAGLVGGRRRIPVEDLPAKWASPLADARAALARYQPPCAGARRDRCAPGWRRSRSSSANRSNGAESWRDGEPTPRLPHGSSTLAASTRPPATPGTRPASWPRTSAR